MNTIYDFAFSEQGYNHIKSDKVCQDSSGHYSDNSMAVVVVADGHGNDNYPRTDRGSSFAVEATITAIKEFVKTVKDSAIDISQDSDSYLEQLAKAGLVMVVKDILGGRRELEIDSSHDFAKALGIDKNQLRRLRKNKGGVQYLAWLKYEKQNKKNYPDQMLKQLEQWQAEPSDLGFILKKMSLVRICNYLKKQSALSGRPVKELIST